MAEATGKSEGSRIFASPDAGYEILLRVAIYLILGSAINFIPVMVNYFSGAGSGPMSPAPLKTVLASGDLLVAVTAMLPLELANLGLNTDKSKRWRAFIIVLGASVQLLALLAYALASANAVSRAQHSPIVFKNMSPPFVATASVVLFFLATIIGSVCEAFIAANLPSPSDQPVPARGSDIPVPLGVPGPRLPDDAGAMAEEKYQGKRRAA